MLMFFLQQSVRNELEKEREEAKNYFGYNTQKGREGQINPTFSFSKVTSKERQNYALLSLFNIKKIF